MRYERLPGFSLGVLTMNTIVTFGGMLLVIVIGMFTTYPDIAVVPIIVGCSLIAVVVPLVFHGSAATLWAALELVMRPLEPKELEDMARHRSDAGTAERSDGPAQRNEGGDTAEGPANGS